MKKPSFAWLIFAASTIGAAAAGAHGITAAEQSTQGSTQAKKIKRDASGRMQLEPLKASDFARRAPSTTAASSVSEQSSPGSEAEKVKRDRGGRMQLEPMKASDFTRRTDGGK